MPFNPVPVTPAPVPETPAEPTTPPPAIGSTVTYLLAAEDLELIAGQQEADSSLVLAVGQACPAIVTGTSGGGLANLKVQLTEEGDVTFWALLRPEGAEPGTWARPSA
ncbi:hypothetical protein [Streptomyces scopuliridis]|uniref:hypothetical protein n=1 Tax=Streptomyces scopuliridis TaxID=452529 RepID=UPI0035D6DB2C